MSKAFNIETPSLNYFPPLANILQQAPLPCNVHPLTQLLFNSPGQLRHISIPSLIAHQPPCCFVSRDSASNPINRASCTTLTFHVIHLTVARDMTRQAVSRVNTSRHDDVKEEEVAFKSTAHNIIHIQPGTLLY